MKTALIMESPMSGNAHKPEYSNFEQRWQAVKDRDPGAAGRFIYAVKTTGIYCRPGCSSRLPLKQNVEFFDSPAKAKEAGFRACKRCNPDETAQLPKAAQADPRVLKACQFIEESPEPPTLAMLAKEVGLSRFHLQRLFKALLGISPKQYAQQIREKRLRAELNQSGSVTRAMYAAGYGSSSRLYENAAQKLGMTPGQIKQGGQGLRIEYASAPCSLGWVLVARTAKGVCAIELGDSQDNALASLENRFPRARIIPADKGYEQLLDSVVGFLDNPEQRPELPLDIQGTAFQRQVWKALTSIPPGTRISYGDLAGLIGRPGSARAVAGAVAKNPLAVLIPCHRVVRTDGGLGGYRWGVKRKKTILDKEAGE
jgi:AraC family transcriptional regulator of adaptative response/methylated-DNA-[protein]-cysteine methyltransferase